MREGKVAQPLAENHRTLAKHYLGAHNFLSSAIDYFVNLTANFV